MQKVVSDDTCKEKSLVHVTNMLIIYFDNFIQLS